MGILLAGLKISLFPAAAQSSLEWAACGSGRDMRIEISASPFFSFFSLSLFFLAVPAAKSHSSWVNDEPRELISEPTLLPAIQNALY